MSWRHAGWIAVLGLLGGAAAAEQPAAEPAVEQPVLGQSTQQWLASQREGKQASAKPQPLSGRVQEEIFERYRKSFSQPIPERFPREQVSGAGAAR